jgi:hypothetical protein
MFVMDSRFKKVFNEMEKSHLHLHERLNAWKEKGQELEARLREELNAWELNRPGRLCSAIFWHRHHRGL